MGKVKRGPTEQSVSPYLKRPLRTLAHVLASRNAAQDTAGQASPSRLGAKAQPSSPPLSEGTTSAAD